MKKFFVLLLIFTFLLSTESSFLFAEKDDKLHSTNLISIDFQGTSLYTVLNVLSMKTGMKLISDTNLYQRKIMLSLKDVTAEEALNALLDTYDLYYVKQGDGDIYVIKSKSDGAHITVSRVIFCNYAKAEALKDILAIRSSSGGKIVADTRTNSLIITDLADTLDKMENIIRSLDIPTQQVLLEARIVEFSITNDFAIGTQWNGLFRNGLENPYPYYPTGQTIENKWSPSNFLYTGGNVPASSFGHVGVSILEGDWSINASIGAGMSDGEAKILSNPKLLVLNNQEASIDIIQEIPYTESTSATSEGTLVSATSFKEAGIRLKVKPQINRDGSIVLTVAPEQSYPARYADDGTPVINSTKSTTTLMLKSGETASIGGLIRENETNTIKKVPLLGDIPLLGYLFKSVEKNKTRTELTIFITAKIVN